MSRPDTPICAMDVKSGKFPNGEKTFLCGYGCGVSIWDGNGETPTPLTPFNGCRGASLALLTTTEVLPVRVIGAVEGGSTFTVALGE